MFVKAIFSCHFVPAFICILKFLNWQLSISCCCCCRYSCRCCCYLVFKGDKIRNDRKNCCNINANFCDIDRLRIAEYVWNLYALGKNWKNILIKLNLETIGNLKTKWIKANRIQLNLLHFGGYWWQIYIKFVKVLLPII